MQNIQYISKNKKDYFQMNCSTFDDFQTIDSFLVNIVDLGDIDVWRKQLPVSISIQSEESIARLGEMIINSSKSKIVILLPNNITIPYEFNVTNKEVLCDNLPLVKNTLFSLGCRNVDIAYEPGNIFILEDLVLKADFYFKGCLLKDVIAKAKDTDKPLVVQSGKYLVSTIPFDKQDKLISFLKSIGFKNLCDKTTIPNWLDDYRFYNDYEIKTKMNENINKIIELKERNVSLENELKQNIEYKRLLIETGDELHKLVLKVLKELLDIDLTTFKDVFREDFLFKIPKIGITFIGEVKGVNSNVKNSHISQLQNHYDLYVEDLEEKDMKENIKKLLIINHQKDKPVNEREPINEKQIAKAKRDNVVIIETTALLKTVELFKSGLLTKERFLDALMNSDVVFNPTLENQK